MRRLVSTVLIATFAASVAACGSDTSEAKADLDSGSSTDAGGDARASADARADRPDSGNIDTSGGPTDPIPTKPLEWVWVPFPEAKCRDGSIAGIEVNANPASDDLMIFLEGGGSCWNAYECASNPANFTPSGAPAGGKGVFDRANAQNPVRDWNMVYVPYCTGDLHAGNNPGFDPGIGPQQFVGYANLEKFLGRIVPTFPGTKKVLHTGVSAGGFGALFTAELVGRKFPSTVDLVVLDDSGPAASTAFLPSCIQHEKWTTWGFDRSFLADCGADCPNPDEYLVDYPMHYAKTYPSRRSGLIEANADATILSKWGYTATDCGTAITQAPAPMDAATFEAALLDFRAKMGSVVPDGGTANFGTFYPASGQHTWLGDLFGTLYTAEADGVKLIDWISGIVYGGAPTNVGP